MCNAVVWSLFYLVNPTHIWQDLDIKLMIPLWNGSQAATARWITVETTLPLYLGSDVSGIRFYSSPNPCTKWPPFWQTINSNAFCRTKMIEFRFDWAMAPKVILQQSQMLSIIIFLNIGPNLASGISDQGLQYRSYMPGGNDFSMFLHQS